MARDQRRSVPPDGERSGARRDLNFTRPSLARVYDYVLGGREHFEIDRRAAHGFLNVAPESAQVAKDSRNFLRRGVRYLVGEAGIRQIIDIGSGLPTTGNVHEIAHEIDPTVHVVYVDKDPMVLTHARAMLGDDDTTTVISGDLRAPETIFDDPQTRALIDMDRPFAVLLSGILHHVSDKADPFRAAAEVSATLSPDSYLLISNFLDEDPRAKDLERAFLDSVGSGRFRTWDENRRFFEGLEMVEPGLVYANRWRPDADTPVGNQVETLYVGGVGRKV
ncbi:SAM-dependent methyltransferase [Pseudonocardia sp.]|uniref:SAM-dependent methyltransferase n=1 Tax=Pseudonocardia sp. TaxID=60912 RepID=UPI002DB3FFEB|nr:SAM-dependent methyltransferase [Pseudonocardia sp.]